MAQLQTPKPQVKIIEQPASKGLRFRYPEGVASLIPGVSSTPESKTFPAIQIIGYQGRAIVVVSCVTKDPPYRPHPHNLIGRERCRKGVYILEVLPETRTITFSNLAIQYTKAQDIVAALRLREAIRVDPFRTGYAHRNQPNSIDLDVVRLCIQVFIEGEHKGKCTVPLAPVVSDPIYDKKAVRDLIIVELSDCGCSVDGGRKDIILLCEEVMKDDIRIRFYEEHQGQVIWEDYGFFRPSQVHKQSAICFRPPCYRTLNVTEHVEVFIQLQRPSDGAVSEPRRFQYRPLDSEPDILKRKRQKYENDPRRQTFLHLQEQEKNRLQELINIMDSETAIADTTPSIYGHVNIGFNPSCTPNVALYVHQPYRVPTDPVSPVSPLVDVQYNLLYNGPSNARSFSTSPVLSTVNNTLPTNWNILNSSVDENNLGATSTMTGLPDLDSQKEELKQIHLSSGELEALNLFEDVHESEIQNVAFSALNIETPSGLYTNFPERDSQQMEFKQVHFNSGELASSNLFDTILVRHIGEIENNIGVSNARNGMETSTLFNSRLDSQKTELKQINSSSGELISSNFVNTIQHVSEMQNNFIASRLASTETNIDLPDLYFPQINFNSEKLATSNVYDTLEMQHIGITQNNFIASNAMEDVTTPTLSTPLSFDGQQLNLKQFDPISGKLASSHIFDKKHLGGTENNCSASTTIKNMDNSGVSNLPDLDALFTPSSFSDIQNAGSQQMRLRPTNLNSGKLQTLKLCDTNNLSENLCSNLSLTDLSVLDLVNSAIANSYQTNDVQSHN